MQTISLIGKKIFNWCRQHPLITLSLFFLLIGILAIRGVLFDSGTIGFRHDWEFPSDPIEAQTMLKQTLYRWIDARLGFVMPYMSDYIIRQSIGLLGYLNIGGFWTTRFIILSFFTFSGLFSFLLLRKISTKTLPAIFGSIIYVLNPLTFNKIISGHTNYLFAYTIAPLFLFLAIKYCHATTKKQSWFYLLLSALIFALSGVQMQFPVMLAISLLSLIIIRSVNFKKSIKLLAFGSLFAFLYHLPWLISFAVESIYFRQNSGISDTILYWFIYTSSNLYQSFFLLGGANDYLSYNLETIRLFSPWLASASLLIILILLPLFNSRSRIRLFFLFYLFIVLLLSFFRIFPAFAWSIWSQSFIFSLFREVYHASYLLAIGLSILTATSFAYWKHLLPRQWLSIVFANLIVFTLPFFIDGKLINNLQTYSLDTSYRQTLDNQESTLLLPSLQPLAITDNQYAGYDAGIDFAPVPSLSQTSLFSGFNDKFATYFNSQLYFNTKKLTPVFTRYLDHFGFSSLVFRSNISSWLNKFTLLNNYPELVSQLKNTAIKNVLLSLQSFQTKLTETYQTYNFDKSQIISSGKACYSTGGWRNLNIIYSLTGRAYCDTILSSNDYYRLDLPTQSLPIIINDNQTIDLLQKNPSVKTINAGSFANRDLDPAQNWVSSYYIWWRHPAFASHPNDIAYTESKGSVLNISPNIETGEYQVYAEIFQSPSAGEIRFNYKDWEYTFSPTATSEGFSWIDLGKINFYDNQTINIANLFGSNAIGSIMMIPASQTKSILEEQNNQLASSKNILLLDTLAVGQSPKQNFDFTQPGEFYKNFPEFSTYDFIPKENSLTVNARFTGNDSQDEYASIIYPVNINLEQTPLLSVKTFVKNETAQFWELGLEIDQNNDQTPDNIIWRRLANDQDFIDINQWIASVDQNIDPINSNIVRFRLQPHKEYKVDASAFADNSFVFTISDLSFFAKPNQINRSLKLTNQYDLSILPTPVVNLNLNDRVYFFNDTPTATQTMEQKDNQITVNATYTNDLSAVEYSTISINGDIDLQYTPYLVADIAVDQPSLQFYDIMVEIDSNNDNYADQNFPLEPIYFTDNQNRRYVYFDLIGEMQQRHIQYTKPRLFTVKLLPHRQYNLPAGTNISPMSFNLYSLNFYHDTSLANNLIKTNQSWQTVIDIPASKRYSLFLYSHSNNESNFDINISGQITNVTIPASPDGSWIPVTNLEIPSGKTNLYLVNYGLPATIDYIGLFETGEKYNQDIPTVNINYQKINPSSYSGEFDLSSPAFINFKQTYHKAWQLTLNEKETGRQLIFQPLIQNGWQQTYYINEPGNFTFDLHYSITPLYQICLAISLILLLATITILIYLKYQR